LEFPEHIDEISTPKFAADTSAKLNSTPAAIVSPQGTTVIFSFNLYLASSETIPAIYIEEIKRLKEQIRKYIVN
jgi:hypothetical protein